MNNHKVKTYYQQQHVKDYAYQGSDSNPEAAAGGTAAGIGVDLALV